MEFSKTSSKVDSSFVRKFSRSRPHTPLVSTPPVPLPSRLCTAGKFFSRGGSKVYLSGVTYGPLGPGEIHAGLGDAATTARDFALLKELGVNSLRLYYPPEDAFLEAASLADFQLVVSIPWTDHIDFLGHARVRASILRKIHDEALRLAAFPQVGAILVGNEISSTLARWQGPHRVLQFLEELIDAAHQAAPETLVSYGSYPSTEFLLPENADFAAFNVYLESPETFARYVARLQNLAGDKPLVISEFGADAKLLGPDKQAEMLAWQARVVSESGVAGNFVFAFTDAWHRGGQMVDGWEFGLMTEDRQPKPAFRQMARQGPLRAPLLPEPPKFSVIVCTRNGSRTLEDCLQSLLHLEYPNFETIVVDDGSEDTVPEILARHPEVQAIRQAASGLGVARNTGASAATGSILAYTDDDCMVDPHWLHYLAVAFRDKNIAAAGGPNIAPAPKNQEQACVIAAPGGPAHVLLGDQVAEHVPGCNLAVRRSVLLAIGGFLPKYHAAGDDVDFCWRLLARGYQIAFHAGAMVWHYRRFELGAYLRQQGGYGKAEGLLLGQYGNRFGLFGGAQWKGVVYQSALASIARRRGRIYSGPFGHAAYQLVYAAPLSLWGALVSSIPWLAAVLGFLGLAYFHPLAWWLAGSMILLTLAVPLRQLLQLSIARPYDGLTARGKLYFLLLFGPIYRSLARFQWGLRSGGLPAAPWGQTPRKLKPERLRALTRTNHLKFWSDQGLDRTQLLTHVTQEFTDQGWIPNPDDGWCEWDIQIAPSIWWLGRVASVTEYHGAQKCLTKVRIDIPPRSLWWTVVCLLVSLVAWAYTRPTPFPLLLVSSILLILFLAASLSQRHHWRTRLALAVHLAAQAAGLGKV